MSELGGGASEQRRSGARLLAGNAALAAVYFAVGWLGLRIPIVQEHVTLLWAPTGVALAAVLRFGWAAVPGIALGAFLVNFSLGGPPGLALLIAVGNTLEAVAGAWLLRRSGFRPSLERVRDVLLLLVLGVLTAPMVSAAVGATSLAAFGQIPPDQDASGMGSFWWLGDAMGALLVTPLLLTWTELPRSWRPHGKRVLEALLLGAGLLVASGLTLSTWVDDPNLHPPLAFTLFPFLVWAALRFGPRGAATATLLAAAVAVWATVQGFSLFAGGTLDERILYLHTYLAMAAVTSLLLGAILAERHEAEEERARLLAREREARTEAEAANEAKDRFLAALSHELRTPLTPVLAVVANLEEAGRIPPELRRPLDTIRRNVELEARLIDDLLDLTRIEHGKLELHPEVTDAHKVVEHTIEICCEQEVRTGRLRVVEDLAAPDSRIWADPSRLTQVLWNLLSNSVKFTPPGGTVTVRSRSEGDHLVLQVSDTGVGIDPEVLPHVFDAFQQGRASSPRSARDVRGGGLGLGLAISKAIVEQHGGDLTAASQGRNRGATFTVSLPSALPEGTGELPAIDESVPQNPKSKIQNLSILLVEDHADTAEAMADLLSLIGHRVTMAGTVAEALGAIRRERFDLLLSDLGLPDGSGLDVMREVSQDHRFPGIALSGYGMEEDVRRSREAGFSKHLTKPVSLPALEAAIRQTVRDEVAKS